MTGRWRMQADNELCDCRFSTTRFAHQAKGFTRRNFKIDAIDSFRRQTTRERNYEALGAEQAGLFAATSDPDEAEFRRQLSAALGELPADQRAVVHLKLWEGLTFDAIAELLGLPLNTAASRYRYGLDKLRERLRPLYDEIKHGRL